MAMLPSKCFVGALALGLALTGAALVGPEPLGESARYAAGVRGSAATAVRHRSTADPSTETSRAAHASSPYRWRSNTAEMRGGRAHAYLRVISLSTYFAMTSTSRFT